MPSASHLKSKKIRCKDDCFYGDSSVSFTLSVNALWNIQGWYSVPWWWTRLIFISGQLGDPHCLFLCNVARQHAHWGIQPECVSLEMEKKILPSLARYFTQKLQLFPIYGPLIYPREVASCCNKYIIVQGPVWSTHFLKDNDFFFFWLLKIWGICDQIFPNVESSSHFTLITLILCCWKRCTRFCRFDT